MNMFLDIYNSKKHRGKRPGHHLQRGYTLIELVVVISMTSVLLVVIVGWLHQSLKFGSAMRQRQQNHRNLTELAWQLRDDVRQSKSIAIEDGTRLVIESPTGNITSYTILDSQSVLEREQSGSPAQHSQFELSASSIAHWDSAELPEWISLIVVKQPAAKQSSALKNPNNKQAPDPKLAQQAPASDHSELLVELPIDLHLRVGPNRWAGAVMASNGPDAQENQE